MAKLEEGWNNVPAALPGRVSFSAPSYVNAGQQQGQAGEGGGAVLQYWQLIKRKKWIVFITAVLGALTAFVVLVFTQPVYEAATTVELQGFNGSFMNIGAADPFASGVSTDKEGINTQIRVILSATIRAPVIDLMRRETPPVTPPNAGVFAPLRAIVNGKQDPLVETRKAIGMAGFTLDAKNILGTRIIAVSADSTIPEVASNFVNDIVNEYGTQIAQQRTANTQKTSQWLESQLEETRVKLEQAEGRLQDFARKSGGIFVAPAQGAPGGIETLNDSKLEQLERSLASLQADRIAKQAKYEQVKAASADSLPDLVDDPAYRQDQAKLAELKKQLAKLSLTLTPAHPKIQDLQEQILEVSAHMQNEKDLILKRYQNDYQSVLQYEKLLESKYLGQAGTVSAESDKVSQYGQLQREVALYQSTLNAMLSQLNQSAVASSLSTTNVHVVDPATPPFGPTKPKPERYELMGMAAGCAVGMMLIVGADKFSSWRSSLSFGMPGYSPRYLNVPELGVIPSIELDGSAARAVSGSKWKRLLPGSNSSHDDVAPVVLTAANQNGSIHAESFRLTLTSILLMSRHGRQPKVIVVTSPGPGEGKTTVVSNMAIAVAESGRKVLIIDADLRRPRIHKVFGIEKKEGFREAIAHAKANGNGNGNGSGKAVPTLCETQIEGVFVLPSGEIGDLNLSQIFHSPEIASLLKRLSDQFDLILIDTPPMIQFSDARLMARFADGLILVVRSGITARESAMIAREQLTQDNIEVMGTILNDWDAKNTGRSYYGSKRYQAYENRV